MYHPRDLCDSLPHSGTQPDVISPWQKGPGPSMRRFQLPDLPNLGERTQRGEH